MAEPPWILKHGLGCPDSLGMISGLALGLSRATVDQVVSNVRQFHRDSALAVLLRLNLALTHHRPLDQEDLLWRFTIARQLHDLW
jgi:hypothetical protein